MILKIGGMGMDEESIRQDRELARAAIKGLTSYAEQIAHQGKDEEIGQVRSLVDALRSGWKERLDGGI